jgi:hypothetical protein
MEMSDVGDQTERRRCDEDAARYRFSHEQGASDHVRSPCARPGQAALEILDQLPERQYNSMAHVEKAVGEII